MSRSTKLSKQTQLTLTQEAFAELKQRTKQATHHEVEWVRNALKLDTLTENQLRAVEYLADRANL